MFTSTRHPRRSELRAGACPPPRATASLFVVAMAGVGAMLTSMLGAGCGNGNKGRPPDVSADGGRGDAPPADGGAAFENFLEEVAKAACGWQFRCCSLPEIDALSASSYLTETECVAQSILQLHVLLAAEHAALLEGRLTMDAGKLTACVQQVTARRCTSVLERFTAPIGVGGLLAECQDPFVGHTAVGARCTNLRECVSGSVCSLFDTNVGPHSLDPLRLSASPQLGTPVLAEGICVVDQKEGQRCATSQQCQVGLYCRRTDFVCALPAREGDACLSVEPDTEGPDGPPIICGTAASPLACVADVCRRLPRQGEPCVPNSAMSPQCDPSPALDLVCVGARLGGDGVCKKTVGLGAVCGGLGIPSCSLPLQCAIPGGPELGTCQEPPGEGERCSASTCRPPAVCYTGNMTCVVPPPSAPYGSKCQSDLDCASLSCEFRGSENSMRCVFALTSAFCMGAGATPALPNTTPSPPP